jgi:hypothetical protein
MQVYNGNLRLNLKSPRDLAIGDGRGKKLMKKFMRPIITIGLGLVLSLVSAALTHSTPPLLEGNFSAAAFILQPTPTPPPQPEDLTKIGSTDGIVTMGILIALIVIIPIFLRRKSWMESR